MRRRVVYSVAASLDGFIAGPDGEYEWIPVDPDIDFEALFARFDTLLMGRRTYEGLGGADADLFGKRAYVFSDTLDPGDHPGVTVVRSEDAAGVVVGLREGSGEDIWLFGGGSLFRSLLDLGLVDAVEVALVPVLLGRGRAILPPSAHEVPKAAALSWTPLELVEERVYGKTGTVWLRYDLRPSSERD